jgi:hypothetical protein
MVEMKIFRVLGIVKSLKRFHYKTVSQDKINTILTRVYTIATTIQEIMFFEAECKLH